MPQPLHAGLRSTVYHYVIISFGINCLCQGLKGSNSPDVMSGKESKKIKGQFFFTILSIVVPFIYCMYIYGERRGFSSTPLRYVSIWKAASGSMYKEQQSRE
jgi:hypothetical protein